MAVPPSQVKHSTIVSPVGSGRRELSGARSIEGDWDHVIVGAGSAGCALAARLADAGRRVLLLEAGAPDASRWVRIPLGVGRIIRDQRFVWMFETEPDAATGNRRFYWPRGKLLGGSSSVNGMIWVRGDPARYDEWAASGCPGWDWAAMEPVMRGMEDYPYGDPNTRGRGGPLSIDVLYRHEPIVAAFVQASVAAGIPANPDYNGATHEGVGRLQVTTRRGERCSAAVAYLRPALARGNVRAETQAVVERILFDGRRASGVAFRRNGVASAAHAKRDVIIAAGAIQSPHILELSGVGDGDRLRGLGIEVVHDLPGVGENLSDHYHTRVTYRSRGVLSLNDLARRPWLHGALPWLRYQMNRTGVFAGAGAMIHALARVSPDSRYPDTKIQLHQISSADRTKEAAGLGVDAFSGVSIGYFQLYPESRGSVHAATPDFTKPPRIVANYLATAGDRDAALRGLRMVRRIAGQAPMKRFLIEETRPGSGVDGDDGLMEYIRRNGQTSYHPVGTCRMGGDVLAVVDASCRVHGVDGLRVVDASVMPFIVSSNTNAPAIAIGERAAQIMLSEANS